MTIEEMSIKFANEIYGGNMVEDKWLKARYFYARGAKAVLDEVERILEDNNLWDCEEICNELKALIEQLKK